MTTLPALAAAAVAALALVAPAAAAEDWAVSAGPPAQAPQGVPKSAHLDNFYPRLLRIHAGDRVTFATRGFHTVTFLGPRSAAQLPSVVSTPGKLKALADRTGKPFWWRGLARLEYRTELLTPAGDLVLADRAQLRNRVLSPERKRPRVTFELPTVGTFRYVCLLHPFMKGTIQVVAPEQPVPTQEQVTEFAGRELGADWTTARSLAKARVVTPNAVVMGIGTTRVTVDDFVPARLTIRVGRTVTWANRSPGEEHDVAFGPAAYLRSLVARTDFMPGGRSTRNQVSPFLVYGSDPPRGYVHDGRNHGNGTLIGALTDDKPGTCYGCSRGLTLPGRTRITFTRPGTYRYVCLLHAPAMSGVVVVRR